MKFGKNIGKVVELSDPEWSPFWINYKFLKKKAKVCCDFGVLVVCSLARQVQACSV